LTQEGLARVLIYHGHYLKYEDELLQAEQKAKEIFNGI